MPDEPLTLEQQLAAVAKEYGQYVATQPIDLNGVRAFNEGHQVPASHVERGLVPADAVAKVNTKAAADVEPAASPAPAAKKG